MKQFAGIAQAEHRPSRPEIPVSSPGPRSIVTAAQAMCQAGLRMDPAIVARGRADGDANRFPQITAEDILGRPETALAYLIGFHQRRQFSKCGGEYGTS